MARTDEGVKAAILARIKGIAETELGFDDADESILAGLLGEVEGENRAISLIATSGGVKVVRKIGCRVVSSEESFVVGRTTGVRPVRKLRIYRIQIQQYTGDKLEDLNLAMVHRQKILGELLKTPNLDGTVQHVDDISTPVFNIDETSELGTVRIVQTDITARDHDPEY